jgi:thioesterase domain-containing protein
VFLIPGGGGSTEIFHVLARHLAAENINVFALHYDGVDNENEPLDNLLSIAEKYALQVMQCCDGETVIAGYCIGGIIAYEMGKILHGNGVSQLKVAFIDTCVPQNAGMVPPFDPQKFKREFFKAIYETYSRTDGKMISHIFDDLSETSVSTMPS